MHNEYRAGFAFAENCGLTAFYRFHGYELQFTYPYSRCAYCLQNKTKTFVLLYFRRVYKAQIFSFSQFFFLWAEDLLLNLDRFHLKIVPAEKCKQTIDARKHGIYAPHSIPVAF